MNDLNKIKDILNKDIIPQKVNSRVMSLFLKQLSLLLNSGISIDTSLKIIENQKIDKNITKALANVNLDLDRGLSIYEAFTNNEKYFNPMIIAFIKSGDKSGKFSEILDDLSAYIGEEDKNKSTIKEALTYPVILFFMTILIVVLILNFVLPTFQNLFAESGQSLPTTTKILLAMSEFINNYGFIILLFIIFIVLSILILKRDKDLAYKIDKFHYKHFPFRNLRQEKLEYQISSLLFILRSGDIEINDSLRLVKESFKNTYVKDEIDKIIKDLDCGMTLSNSIEDKKDFSPLFKSMIKIGEDSGNLLEALKRSSQYYANDYIYKLKRIANLAEPIMIIFMSIIVGFVVFSIAIPIFDSVNTI
ncbi:type II secretion system F family protein [Anaerococcus urinomassiliensis]|uniref:type II secretion system F family protein n=1 Tax=Anaerococcus urinomassiliensis TaxID=1745712 RepID=UPI000938CC99|nr:type II secretion system F family protein [Anaerococcus urinomassiliensis]